MSIINALSSIGVLVSFDFLTGFTLTTKEELATYLAIWAILNLGDIADETNRVAMRLPKEPPKP